MLNRRDFLRSSSLVAMGLTVPGFLSRTALAAPMADKGGAKDTILVVVELTGGNDGLNGAPMRVPSIGSLEEFQLQIAATSGADKKDQKSIIEGAAEPGTGTPGLLDFVRRTASNTYASSRRLQEIGKNYQPKEPYPQ